MTDSIRFSDGNAPETDGTLSDTLGLEEIVDTPHLRMGEFLAALEVLTPSQLSTSLKVAREIGMPLGRTLVVRGLLSNEDLGRLMELHCLFKRGDTPFTHIRDAFSMAKRRGWSIRESLAALGCAVDGLETVKLGELMVASELIDDPELVSALELQTLCGLPIGRVFAIDSNVPEPIVETALNYQNSIRSDEMSYSDAIAKLKLMPLQIASDLVSPIIQINMQDLLVAGKVCTENDLKPALSFATNNNISLDRVLCSLDWIDPVLVSAASGLSKLVNRGYLTGQEAIKFLTTIDLSDERRYLSRRNETGDEDSDYEMGSINLYRFLLACGFLTPDNIKELTKSMISRGQDFGKVVGVDVDRNTSKEQLKNLILSCYSDDRQLASVLIEMEDQDAELINHAVSMVDLVVLGGATLEQGLLSFAWARKEYILDNL